MFFGREEQIGQLEELLRKRTASLVTCRGRRRIGKSTLIEVFARRAGCRFIKIEGRRPLQSLSNADELMTFAQQLADQTAAETTPPANWMEAFRQLNSHILDSENTVVLLDEVSWLAHYDKCFADDLKIAWDNLFKKHDRLIFVLCGSVSSWLRDNIIDCGAFMGRRSLDIIVKELPLADCVKFWGRAASRINAREIIDVLSVTGGIPRYLEEIDPSLSAEENIRRLCFRPNSVLRTDFDEMFSDVITRQPTFTASVMRTLVEGSRGVTEIANALGLEKGGRITDALSQLEEAGIVASDCGKNPESGKDARAVRYRLRDNYSRFYLKYIEPEKSAIDSGAFSLGSLDRLDGWDSVMGLAFENLVVNNLRELVVPLGFGSALLTSAAPYRRAASRDGARDGVQVDLLVQARRAICIVEIKRQREIGREVIDEVAEKVRRVPHRDGISVRTALVYEGHLAPIVEADGYFDAVIPFSRLLRL